MIGKTAVADSDFEKIKHLLQEFARNPDGPLGLKVQSQLNQVVAPRIAKANAIVQAMMVFDGAPTDANREAINHAIREWEMMDGENNAHRISPEMLHEFETAAKEALIRQRQRPPEMSSILADCGDVTDYEYEVAGLLTGIKGRWHGLWSLISFHYAYVTLGLASEEESSKNIAEVRAEFESLLGRPMTDQEYDRLHRHAIAHSIEFMIPVLKTNKDN
jgi:hypothetical protein